MGNYEKVYMNEHQLTEVFPPVFMILAGLGIAGIWTVDIISGKFSDRGNFFRWREGENLMWPHIVAEYLTAAGLFAGAIGLLRFWENALPVSFISLGAVLYSAINSSGWVLASKNRIMYGIPIWITLAGAIASLFFLIC
jgi:hypothetical protein